MRDRSQAIDPEERSYAGQRVYTPWFLRIYDPFVLGLYCRFVWRCPTPRIVALYEQHVGRRHLDVGPGTGALLDRARLPEGVEVTLLDPNPDVLRYASRRLDSVEPSTVEADVLKPLPDLGPFDSIGLNYVLHCLPGPMAARAGGIERLGRVLDPDGVLFGATILGSRDVHNRLSYAALRENVRRGYFDNLGDTDSELERILTAMFREVDIEIVGSAALFAARGIQRPGEHS